MSLIVKDSSLWKSSKDLAAYNSRLNAVMMGTIRQCYTTATGQVRYAVEIFKGGHITVIQCEPMTRFGGLVNYEDYRLRPYKTQFAMTGLEDSSPDVSYEQRVGDVVVIACIHGHPRNGVILGGLAHPARKQSITPDEIAYISQFNGIETTITAAGGYKVLNKGNNTLMLDSAIPGQPAPPEVVNPLGGSFFELADDFSISLSDGAQQTILIDKSGNTTSITSGQITIELAGTSGGVTVSAMSLTADITQKAAVSAMDLEIKVTNSTKLNSMKVAIGNSSFELLDGLIKLIDALGTLIVVSPNGPCNPMKGAATWAQVEMIKTQINTLKGSL